MAKDRSSTMANQITEGVIWKQLLWFFFPILFGTFFQQLYNTTDAVIVGNYVGKEALAAVGGPAATIINLLVGFFVGISSGASVIISQYYGSGEHSRLEDAVHTAIALAITGGAAMMVIGIVFAPISLELLNTPQDIMESSTVYMRIYFLGIIPSMIYNMGSGILRAIGDSKRPVIFLIISCGINIILDLFFVVQLDMGVTGVAVATSISQVISAGMTVFVLVRSKEAYRLILSHIKFHKKILQNILKIGLPSGVQAAMYSISNLVIQAAINDYGTDTVAAWTAFGKLDSFFWMIMSAYGIAVTTFAGQNFGAGKLNRVKQSVRITIGLGSATSVFFSFIVLFYGHILLRLFTQDAVVIDICMDMVKVVSPAYITYVCIEVLSGACRGCGDAFKPMVLTLFGVCVLRILWIMIAGAVRPGIDTICFSYPLTWTITSILFIIYYRKGKWMYSYIR